VAVVRTWPGCPTDIAVSQFDPLRDEGTAYASRLLECGVVTELHCFPGTFTDRRWPPTRRSPCASPPSC
jgi:acetyl esterase/lipase